jgi:hypothetical protein
MSKDLKSIIDQIKKVADIPRRSKGPKTTTPTTPVSQSTVPSRGNTSPSKPVSYSNVGSGIPAVREMQLSMQDLAQVVMEDSRASTMSLKHKDSLRPDATDSVKKSKKAFNDFIAEQYMGSLNEDTKGVEWNKDSKIVSHPDKKQTQTDIYELDVVMDTLSRIGA